MRTDTSSYTNPQEEFIFKIEIPNALCYMVFLTPSGFVPGITDLVYGNETQGILSYNEKIERGAVAIETLKEMKKARDRGDEISYFGPENKIFGPPVARNLLCKLWIWILQGPQGDRADSQCEAELLCLSCDGDPGRALSGPVHAGSLAQFKKSLGKS